MISMLIYILIVCLIMAAIWWVISMLPLPPVAKQIANVVIVVIFLVFLVYLLLPFATNSPHWRVP